MGVFNLSFLFFFSSILYICVCVFKQDLESRVDIVTDLPLSNLPSLLIMSRAIPSGLPVDVI